MSSRVDHLEGILKGLRLALNRREETSLMDATGDSKRKISHLKTEIELYEGRLAKAKKEDGK